MDGWRILRCFAVDAAQHDVSLRKASLGALLVLCLAIPLQAQVFGDQSAR